jgi:hypothetical protein
VKEEVSSLGRDAAIEDAVEKLQNLDSDALQLVLQRLSSAEDN